MGSQVAMLERIPGEWNGYQITCDQCGASESYTADDFMDAVNQAKVEGWQPYKVTDKWEHLCPDCKADLNSYKRERP